MFLVPTLVAPSPIGGVGVFTPIFIRAGTILWEFTPGVDLRLPPEVILGTPAPLGPLLRRYCYEEEDGRLVLCGDNARFMNHSFDPNCDDVEGPYTIARTDILPGTELTCDYRSFDLESRKSGLEEWKRP